MASTTHIASSPTSEQVTSPLRRVWKLRLITGYIALVGHFLFLLGLTLDIQWHATVGRDRTFTVLHDTVLIGISISGLAALVDVLLETRWARRSLQIRENSTTFGERFHGALGAYVLGFGATAAAASFPLDSYWHSLYGIDTSLWTPFHVMILASVIIAGMGTTYMLLSAAHLAQTSTHRISVAAGMGYAGGLLTIVTWTETLLFFVRPALSNEGAIQLPFGIIDLYPLVVALFVVAALTTVVRAFPWLGTVTCVAALVLLLSLAFTWFVLPVTTLLIQIEHQPYLPRQVHAVIGVFGIPPLLIVTAIAMDLIAWWARRRKWSFTSINKGTILTCIVTMFFVAGISFLFYLQYPIPGLVRLDIRIVEGITSFLSSLLLVVPGTLIGGWFGLTMGQSLHEERS